MGRFDRIRFLASVAISMALLAAAGPTHAGSELKLSLRCSESVERDLDDSKMVKSKFGKRDVIRWCLSDLGVPADEIKVSDFRVIFDDCVQPAGELRVVRRKTDELMCSLSEPGVFVEAPPEPPEYTGAQRMSALYDWTGGDAGRMQCSRKLKKSIRCDKEEFCGIFGCEDYCTDHYRLVTKWTATCEGSVLFNGLPCELKVKSKRTDKMRLK